MTYSTAYHALGLAAAILGFLTCPVSAIAEPLSFHGEQHEWTLVIRDKEAIFDERSSRSGFLWTTTDFVLSDVKDGSVLNATFWSTHVVAHEAVDQPMSIVAKFSGGRCKDYMGHVHSFSVVLKFGDNPEAQRGCGDSPFVSGSAASNQP